jgi:hypothetical protein
MAKEGHLGAATSNQLGYRLIGVSDRVLHHLRRLVPTDFPLQPQMRSHRLQRRLRHERRPRIVQMDAMGTPRRMRPQSRDIHQPILMPLEPTTGGQAVQPTGSATSRHGHGRVHRLAVRPSVRSPRR